MRIPKNIPEEIKRLINAILKRYGDCEIWLNGYNSALNCYTWYGDRMICEPLFCSYGFIGYAINYRGYEIHVDNDLDRISIIELQKY